MWADGNLVEFDNKKTKSFLYTVFLSLILCFSSLILCLFLFIDTLAASQVLKNEPCLISLAVEGFYDRDIDSMKYAAKMERFYGSGEEIVEASVRMSRAMYAQLMQQTFQAPKGYPMPLRGDARVYAEAELGMKIACGFEMMYQLRKKDGVEGKGSTWEAFRESLERSGYFEGLLPGSKEYRRLMENGQEYFKNSSLYSRARYAVYLFEACSFMPFWMINHKLDV